MKPFWEIVFGDLRVRLWIQESCMKRSTFDAVGPLLAPAVLCPRQLVPSKISHRYLQSGALWPCESFKLKLAFFIVVL